MYGHSTETFAIVHNNTRSHYIFAEYLRIVTAIFCIFEWDKNKHKRYAWLCKVHFKKCIAYDKHNQRENMPPLKWSFFFCFSI